MAGNVTGPEQGLHIWLHIFCQTYSRSWGSCQESRLNWPSATGAHPQKPPRWLSVSVIVHVDWYHFRSRLACREGRKRSSLNKPKLSGLAESDIYVIGHWYVGGRGRGNTRWRRATTCLTPPLRPPRCCMTQKKNLPIYRDTRTTLFYQTPFEY